MDLFTSIFKSFWSVEPFQRAAYVWKWKILSYFLMLCVISTIGAIGVASKMMEEFISSDVRPAIGKLEGVTIKDGKLDIPNGKPIELKSADGNVFGIVTSDYLDANQAKGLMFSVEKDRMSFYLPNGEETFLPLDAFGEISGTKGDIPLGNVMESVVSAAWILTPITIFLASILINGIYAAIMSVATFVLSFTSLPTLGYFRSLKMAVVSLTPPIVVDLFAMPIFGVGIPGFVFALISCALVLRAMRSMRNDNAR